MNDQDLITIIAAYMITEKVIRMDEPPTDEEGDTIVTEGVAFATELISKIREAIKIGSGKT